MMTVAECAQELDLIEAESAPLSRELLGKVGRISNTLKKHHENANNDSQIAAIQEQRERCRVILGVAKHPDDLAMTVYENLGSVAEDARQKFYDALPDDFKRTRIDRRGDAESQSLRNLGITPIS